MANPQDCPECGSWMTESVDRYFSEDKKLLLDERLCSECNMAFDVFWRYKKTEILGDQI